MQIKNRSYITRLIRDLAETFNNTPLTAQEIARYWKRSRTAVIAALYELKQAGVISMNNSKEFSLTANYLQFYRRNPGQALQVAKAGF